MRSIRIRGTAALTLAWTVGACGSLDGRDHHGENAGGLGEPIINGTPVTQETQGVLKLTFGLATCSGTLLTNSWVLTAGHCVSTIQPDATFVQHEDTPGHFTGPFDHVPDLAKRHPSLDVAVIHVSPPFNVFGGTNTVNNVQALQNASYFVGKSVTCYGYGANATNDGGSGTGSGTLRQALLLVSSADDANVTVSVNTLGQVPFHGDSGGPCFYVENGYRYQVGLGVGVDNDFTPRAASYASATGYRDWVDGAIFSSEEGLGGGFTSSPGASTYGANTLELFGRGNDLAVWEQRWTGTAWSAWESLGGYATSNPAAAPLSSTSMLAVVRGPDSGLWYRTSTSMVWGPSSSPWSSLGGYVTSSPATVNSQDGRVWVFGRGGDNALWYRTFSGSSWSAWASLGGNLASDPAAASMTSGIIHVFALTPSSTVQVTSYSPSMGWSGWTTLDGIAVSNAPVVTSSAGSVLDLFARHSDGSIGYRRWYGVWGPWKTFDLVTTSNPAVTSWGTGRIDMVFRGANNDMRHTYWGG